MNVVSGLPTAVVQRPDHPGLALRLNQKVAAEVLGVSGEQVSLVLEGARVVARLTSAEQAAALIGQRYARFVVRELSADTIVLALANAKTGELQANGPDVSALLSSMLREAGLPAEDANLHIARALMGQGLPVTAELVAELRTALDGSGQVWGEQQALLAAELKASGLPLTSYTLGLMARAGEDLGEARWDLMLNLARALQDVRDPALRSEIQVALRFLRGMGVDVRGNGEQIAASLRQSLQALGRSVESGLARLGLKNTVQTERADLIALARLPAQLKSEGQTGLAEKVEQFIEQMRSIHLGNAEPALPSGRGSWLEVPLPIAIAQRNEHRMPSAKFRIAKQPGKAGGVVDAANTRVVVGLELLPGRHIEVDLTLVGKRVGARVETSDEALRAGAESEMSLLREGLNRLGYSIQSAQVKVARKRNEAEVKEKAPPHQGLNLEV